MASVLILVFLDLKKIKQDVTLIRKNISFDFFFIYFFKNKAIIVFKNLWHIFFRLHNKIGQWAEDAIIQASADKYCLHIFVSFYTNHKEVIRTVAKPVQAERENYKSIFLNLENGHYTIIAKGKKYFFVYINCIFLSMLLCIKMLKVQVT